LEINSPSLVILALENSKKIVKRIINLLPEDVRIRSRILYPKTSYMLENDDILIRWGCTSTTHSQYRDELTINERIAIMSASIKPSARIKMIENGLLCPQISTELPCIARRIKHKRGKDLVFCTSEKDIFNAKRMGLGYFQEYIPKDREYRVHVAHGGVLSVQEKIDIEDSRTLDPINWNHDNGFIFEVIKWSKIPKGICKPAIDACKLFELDFGAVDVIEKDNKFYILEINSAPAVENYTASKYAEYFSWIFEYYLKYNELPGHWNNRKKYIIRREEFKI